MTRIKMVFLLGAAVLVAATGAGFADDIHIGAHAGISIPDIRGSQTNLFSKNFTSRRGPYFGLTAEIPLAGRFSLAADLNYTSQGGIRDGMQPITMDTSGLPVPPGLLIFADFRNETVLDYLEIPLLARVTFGDKLKFFLDLGPYAGYLVRGKALTEGVSPLYLDEAGTMPIIIPPATEPLEVDLGAATDVKDSVEPFNFGLAGGGGLSLPVGPGRAVLEVRFQLGLTHLQKDPADGITQTGAVLVSLGYVLPVGRPR
jgi:Outer membrane protein beta-barrel domain